MQIPESSRLALFFFASMALGACGSGGGNSGPVASIILPNGLKFSPASGVTNTLVTIEGKGFSSKSGENEVRFGGALASILVSGPDAILAYVPNDAKTGPITVKSPVGFQNSPGDFLVVPFITKLVPDRGGFGQEIQIEGSGFAAELEANAVVFSGGVSAPVTASTSNSIVVLVPPGAQTGEVSVTTSSGSATSATPFFVLLQPAVASFAPASGKVGATVTVQGNDFGPLVSDNAVQFGGVAAAISSASTSTIVCTVPDGALTNPVSVTTFGGTGVSAQPFLVQPEVFSLSTPVAAAGVAVTVSGRAFESDIAKDAVLFNGLAGIVQSASYNSVTALVPPGASSGPVTVVTPGGSAVSAASLLVLPGPPVIASVSPASGTPGTAVTISGQNFSPFAGTNAVAFNGVDAAVSSVSATQIVASVPLGATSGPITVTTPGGTDASDTSFTVLKLVNLRYAYAANFEDGTISGYQIESNYGFLRHRGYALSGAGASAGTKALLVHPSAPLLLAANSGDDTISLFRVESDGRLTKTDQKTAGGGPSALAWDATGTRAYAVNETGNSVSMFTVDINAQTLAPLSSPVATGAQPKGIAVTPDGKFAYVANAGSNNVSAYSIDAGGQLTALGGAVGAGAGPSGIAVDPAGSALYVSNAASHDLSAFTIQASGALQPSATIPLGAGTGPVAVAVDPFNRFVFTANKQSDTVSLLIVTAPGSLAGPIPLPAKDGPSSVTPDPTGRFVYITHSFSNQVMLYGLDSGGNLYSKTITTRGGPSSLALFTLGDALQEESKFVFATSQGSDSGALYSIDPATGQLTLKDSKPVGNDPTFAVADPFGRFVFVANSATADSGPALGNSVYTMRIDATAGTASLTQALKMTPFKETFSVAIDPAGRFLVVPHTSDDKISIFAIDPTTGALSGQQTYATGGFPRHAAFDPSGRFLYVANQLSDNVSIFSCNAWTGTLNSLGSVVAPGAAVTLQQLFADPQGRFLFASDAGNIILDRGVFSFPIDPVTGMLSVPQKIANDPFQPAGTPDSIATDPFGVFLYWGGVNAFGIGNLGAYSINASTGALTAVAGSPFFVSPASGIRSVAMDAKGLRLFTANAGTTNLLQTHSATLGVPAAALGGAPAVANPSSVAVVSYVK